MPILEFDYLQSLDDSIVGNAVVLTPLTNAYFQGVASVVGSNPKNTLHLQSFDEKAWEDFSTPESVEQKISKSLHSKAEWAVILGRGAIVGAIYAQELFLNRSTMNLGYWVVEQHIGQGYASSAIQLMTDYVLEHKKPEVVMASPRTDNIPSRKALVRAGFSPTKTWKSRPANVEHITYEKHSNSLEK